MIWLLACRAVHVVPYQTPVTVTGPRLEVEVPTGWSLEHNRRNPVNQHLSLAHDTHNSLITVDLIREDRSTTDLPLSMVAEGLALQDGRLFGIESLHTGTHRLEVAGREAWAVTTTQSHGPNEQLVSTVALRAEKHMAVLSLRTSLEAPPVVVQGWGQVLQSFRLPADPAPEPNLLDEGDRELGPL